MFITRLLFDTIISHTSNKIIVIYGPRQVGKTTLTKLLVDHYNLKTLHISGENVIQHNYFQYEDFEKLSAYIQDYAMIVVDEAQKISNIGMILKLIYDTYPEKKIIVTGSSSLDLANGISESLTGRKLVYHLYPLAMCELDAHLNLMELDQYHKTAMIYGLYPEVYTTV
jgi:predicted AAA+ superfamily ATPase